jgi:hypothetical protein
MTRTYYMREGEARQAPFSLRLTRDERETLESRAGTMPLGAYIKSVLFADDAPKYRARRKSPVADTKALADVLACLGASRIPNNLNQLAKAANTGSLYFDEETKRDLSRACDDIRVMRALLMTALGLKVPEPFPDATPSLCFTIAANPKAGR